MQLAGCQAGAVQNCTDGWVTIQTNTGTQRCQQQQSKGKLSPCQSLFPPGLIGCLYQGGSRSILSRDATEGCTDIWMNCQSSGAWCVWHTSQDTTGQPHKPWTGQPRVQELLTTQGRGSQKIRCRETSQEDPSHKWERVISVSKPYLWTPSFRVVRLLPPMCLANGLLV